jgi:hypothetical protein
VCVVDYITQTAAGERERESRGNTFQVLRDFTVHGKRRTPFCSFGLFFFCSCDDGGRGRRFERNKKNKKKKTQILNGVESTHTHIPKGICCFICVWLLLLLLKLNRSRWIGLTGVGAIVSIFLLWLVTRYIRQE